MTKLLDEKQFRSAICQKHQPYFNHTWNLFEFAQEAMGTFSKANVTSYETVLWLVLARAFKSFDSIRRLCEIAHCEDAGVILRSLLNLLAIVRWISIEPEKRAPKYLAWYWIEMRKDAEINKTRIPPEWVQKIEKHYAKSKRLFEYKDGRGKDRMAKKWHQPEAHNIEDLFKQVDLEKQYEEGYRILSGLEHSDATSYFAMVAGMEKGENTRSLSLHNDLFVPHYLRNAFQYFADIFRICNKGLNLAGEERFEATVQAGLEFFRTEMSGQ